MSATFTTDLNQLLTGFSPVAALRALYQTAIELNLPVALWRVPQNQQFFLCISFNDAIKNWQPKLEDHPPGFAFCPFLNSETAPSIFIPADLVFNPVDEFVQVNTAVSDDFSTVFLKSVQKMLADTTFLTGWHQPLSDIPEPKSKTEFIDFVNKGIETIREEKLEKIVPSRYKKTDLPENFDLLKFFRNLTDQYPRAFVSLVSVPEIGTWVGATPEVLVSVENNRIFKTMALAGTQAITPNETIGQAVWRQKEIEEQALVVRYIISCFKKLRLREYNEIGPRTIIAGNLMHLRTDFTVDIQATGFPNLGTQMLELLHPTSAVCGMPLEPAFNFLKQNEGYNRTYYSGFLGPVQVEQNSHIFVNLRCMQLLETQAVLYAGAGVTCESDPEKEWLETELKMETLLDKLRVKS